MSNAETKVYSVDCLLALATAVTHDIVDGGKKVITKVIIGGQTSQCEGDVIATGQTISSLMDNNLDIALNAAVEAIENGAGVFVNGNKIVIATEEEQHAFKNEREAELLGKAGITVL